MEKIIVMDKDRDYISNMDLYSFIDEQYKYGNAFMVCHVTEKEFKLMEKFIMTQHCLPERTAKKAKYGYDKGRYLMAYNFKENVIELANYDITVTGDSKGRYYINNGNIVFDSEGYPFTTGYRYDSVSLPGYRVYTTETYDNVLNHYSKNNSTDMKKLLSEYNEKYMLLEKRKNEIENSQLFKEYNQILYEMDVLSKRYESIRENLNESNNSISDKTKIK